MSNGKCLITQLMGEFENDNLPVYDQVTLSYGGGTGNNSFSVYIAAGDGEVTVKSKDGYPFKTDPNSSVLDKTEITIQANSASSIYYEKTLGANPISGLLTIIGMYNVKEIQGYSTNSILDFTPTAKNNIEGMLKHAPLDALGGYFGDDLEYISHPENIKCLTIQGVPRPKIMNIDAFTNLEKVSYCFDPSTLNGGYIALTSALSVNTHLKSICNTSVKGNIVNLPQNIKCVSVGTADAKGSLNALVERLSTDGRTSGSIAFYYPKLASSITVTFGENTYTLKTLWGDGTITHVNAGNNLYAAILSWDANGMWFATSIPSELTDYCANYKLSPTWVS